MAAAFTRVSLWLWGGAGKVHHDPTASTPHLNASTEFGFREAEDARFPGNGAKMKSTRPRRKWQSREERWQRVDRELDVVLVPSDGGGCLSGSESDDSDWSIGWLEPHGPDFFSDGCGGDPEVETSFAVLVPCYVRGRGGESSSNKDGILGAVDLDDGFSSDGKRYVEQWLSSLRSTGVPG